MRYTEQVVTLGNRGGHPDRSKYYHNYGCGQPLNDCGIIL